MTSLRATARRNRESAALATGEDDDTSPLLVSRGVPIEDTHDRQLRNYLNFLATYFHQWKHSKSDQEQSQMRIQLRHLTDLLPAFLGARDYVAAGKVLSVLYYRFSITPALCAQSSLEILRRQPDMGHDLVAFYRAAIEDRRLDKLMMLKELWTYYIIQGDFYEAYHLYHDEIQEVDISDDHRLFADYGVLCYWLLLVESSEIREKLRKEEEEEDMEDGEDDDSNRDTLPKVENIEHLIESKYAFKSPIGVHILYQSATNALRRAVGLSPSSALFLEYYVQLLVLAGEIDTACDYLEDFYRSNSEDPHGARMLVGFLEKYYPDSGEEQARIYARWMRNDPAALFPLERLMDLYGAGSVSTDLVVEAIANSLDTCGGDLHLAQNPVVCVTLWKHFAETIVAMDEEELMRTYDEEEDGGGDDSKTPHSRDNFLADFGARHQWWKRVYFAKPAKLDDVSTMTAAHPDLLDVWIFRAAVADRVFPDYSPSTEVLRQAVKLPVDAVKGSHVRLFKSFFGVKFDGSDTQLPTAVSPSLPKSVTNIEHSNVMPIMTGDSITSRVLPRSLIVKDTQHAKRGWMNVAIDTEAVKLDEELSAELQQAVEYQSIHAGEKTARDLESDPEQGAARTKRYKEHTLTTPLYINLIEEATYGNPGMTTRHLYRMTHEKLRGTGAMLPSLIEVDTARRVFVVRWMRNLHTYGNCGLLTRYEAFIMRHILIAMLHGQKEFPPSFVDELLIQMKRELPSSHVHFPDHRLMEVTMPKLIQSALRLRRRKFFEVRNAMRGLCQQAFKITYEDLVEIAWAVCEKNHLNLFVTRDQVCKLAYTAIGTHFKWVLRSLDGRTIHTLNKPSVAHLTDPVQIHRKIGTKVVRYFIVYAKLWLDAYQRKRVEEGEVVDSDEERVLDERTQSDMPGRGRWIREKRREVILQTIYGPDGAPRRGVEEETKEDFQSDAAADNKQAHGGQHLIANGGKDAVMGDAYESRDDSKGDKEEDSQDDDDGGEGDSERGDDKDEEADDEEESDSDGDDEDADDGDDGGEDSNDGDVGGESDGDSTESDITLRKRSRAPTSAAVKEEVVGRR